MGFVLAMETLKHEDIHTLVQAGAFQHPHTCFLLHFNNPHRANTFRSDCTCFHCPGFSTNKLVLMIPTAKSMKSSFTVKNFALQK